jgi:2-keto-4-pentenoate hydratase/2-oxohepta-3-ene-1,7-dioic acid hydratase in catechol pathway
MRLVSYGPRDKERAGLLRDDMIIDLERGLKAAGLSPVTSDLRVFLEQTQWRAMLDRLASADDRSLLIDPADVRLGPPVPTARKLLIAGSNTHSHIAEAGQFLKGEPPLQPVILAKSTSSMAGPADDIIMPPETAKLDYEVELGVVIGRRGRRIRPSEVEEYLAGYTVINDVSARDVQLAEHEKNPFYRMHFLGKSFDTFAPMGPHLVTVDEIPWGDRLRLRTWVDDELRQDSDTSDLYFGIAELVAHTSNVMTLDPGDVIATGSPAGVAFFMKPPAYLKSGQIVTCEIERIGQIRNAVRSECG